MTHSNQLSYTEWTPNGFPKDTLVYTLGQLANNLMLAAFMETQVTCNYRNWEEQGHWGSDSEKKKTQMCLLQAGMSSGHVRLIARERSDEFFLQLEHPKFETLIAVGFDINEQVMFGIFVAEFRGSIEEAIDFARKLDKEVRVRMLGALSIAEPPSPQDWVDN